MDVLGGAVVVVDVLGRELVVVDVLEDPESAETGRVLTTPTLVREQPAPARRITGDLSDLARVADALDILPSPDGRP